MPYETSLGFLGKVLSGDGAAHLWYAVMMLQFNYLCRILFGWQPELQKQKVILPIVFLQSVRISFGASGTRK